MLHISFLMHEIGVYLRESLWQGALASALYNDNSVLPYIYVIFSEGSKTLYRQYCSSSEYA